MRAWYYTAFGDASVVKLGDQPEAKIVDSHDIVVKVHAAALNPIDFKRRRGDLKLILTQHWPAIVGYDVSGVVVSCGPDATKFRVGDAVFATLPNTRIGSLAEFVSAHENVFAKKPSNLTHVQAASLAMTSLTSLLAFRRANLTPGKKVLITAGAGGVGASAIQIAKQVFQATDIATTASAKKADKVKELGATQVIDYNKDKFCDVLKDYDVALDCSKESVDCFKIIKPKGSVISIAEVPSPDLLYKRESEGIKISWFVGFALRMLSYSVRRKAQKADINYEFFFLASNGEALDEIRAWCEEGKLVPVLDKVYEFEKADEALAYLETGRATGKVVVEVVKEE